MRYQYETHCHSSLCSRCAHSSPRELVRAYHRIGFSGLVLTDHFVHGNTCVSPVLPWAERMRCYYNAFEEAQDEAIDLDFDVIFGLEHAYGNGLEVLCYGIDLDFLLINKDLDSIPITEFANRVHTYGGVVIHAHPYRYGGSELQFPLEILDGIEVYNAGNSYDSNVMAKKLATSGDYIMTAGTDLHSCAEKKLGTAGITLPYRVHNGKQLVEALRKHDHNLILPEEA